MKGNSEATVDAIWLICRQRYRSVLKVDPFGLLCDSAAPACFSDTSRSYWPSETCLGSCVCESAALLAAAATLSLRACASLELTGTPVRQPVRCQASNCTQQRSDCTCLATRTQQLPLTSAGLISLCAAGCAIDVVNKPRSVTLRGMMTGKRC